MTTKTVLGHIDCPTCGTTKGMRITPDRNDEPFGFCEAECGQQLRIGGNERRVRAFVARFPWAGKPVTVTVPVPEQNPTPPAPPPATPKTAPPVPEQKPPPAAPKKGGWFQPLLAQGAARG